MRGPGLVVLFALAVMGGGGCGGGSGDHGTAPEAPAPVNAAAGAARQIVVRWGGVEGADHYVVTFREGSGPEQSTDVAGDARGRVFARLPPQATYTFTVAAVDSAGRSSARSAEVSATARAGPMTAVPAGDDGAPNGYYEYLPPGYGDGAPRPLLLDFHGSGSNGDGALDLDRLLTSTIPLLIQRGEWPASRPFVALFPQNAVSCPSGEQVHAFATWAMAHYVVDPKQVYLTGLSCGAIAAWDYLATYTDAQVAAAVLLAGDPGTAWSRAGCDLGKVAIWAFHGTADTDVPIAPMRALMQQLLACPSPPREEVEFTEIQGADHLIFDDVYRGNVAGDVFEWLLAHPK